MIPRIGAPLLLLAACSDTPKTAGTGTDTTDTVVTDTETDDTGPKTVATADLDGDGYAPPFDCDEGDPDVHPLAEDEWYDGVDSDCAGDSDFDQDRDGADLGPDCDDASAVIYPGAPELCNDVDDDCDQATDEDPINGILLHPDADGDGYGAAGTVAVCDREGFVLDDDDCDDADADRFPGNPEVCDGVDNDCDAEVDDGVFEFAGFPDADGDGQGDGAQAPVQTCFALAPGTVEDSSDCDDTNDAVYFGAPDVLCDGLDNDCDALTGEVGAVTVDGVAAADLDAALATAPAGAVIALCEGRYSVTTPSIPHALTLSGAGSAVTVIDGQDLGSTLAVDTTDLVKLEGVTLTGGIGRTDPLSTTRQGGGLRVQDGGFVELTDVVVAFNHSGEGSGVWLGDDVVLTLTGGGISDNTGDPAHAFTFPEGGGLFAGENATITLIDAEVARNSAEACGGMSLWSGVLVGVGASAIRANESDGLAGGGLCAVGGLEVSDLEISENVSGNSGGGISSGTPLALTRVTMVRNVADLEGGAVALVGSDPSTFSECVFDGNEAGTSGGALDLSGLDLTLVDSEVTGNSESFFARSSGGAEVGSGTLSSIDTTWSGNLSADVGIGAYAFAAGAATTFTCDSTTAKCQ